MKAMARSSRNRKPQSPAGAGREGCPCVDTTADLASLVDRACSLPDGGVGIRIDLDNKCLPHSYGASRCRLHDQLHDEDCALDVSGEAIAPAYCFRPWCFVDAASCSRDSDERVIRSSYFPRDSGLDMFYSYTTCNSTSDEWKEYESDHVLGEYFFNAIIPTYFAPNMYKRDPDTEEILLSTGIGNEYFYYDNDVPFEGIYPNYMQNLIELSNGDIEGIAYSHRSRASSIIHPKSKFTAAVQDVSDGLADIAVGPFWITGERLKLTSFTVPVVVDKVYLVVPSQGLEEPFRVQFEKVLKPFTKGLWGFVILTIFYAALLSTWLSAPSAGGSPRPHRDRQQSEQGQSGRVQRKTEKKKYLRRLVDEFLHKGTEFTGAAVGFDSVGSLPVKILGFGFGFFVLVTVSSYVANLAAFLTRSMISESSITTMEGAVSKGRKICAHPVIEEELRNAWPEANFYFHRDENEYRGMLDDYEARKCQVLLFGWEDSFGDEGLLKRMCANDLVFTDDIVIEIPIGFPIIPSLGHSLSYWIFEGQKRGRGDISIQGAKDDYLSKRPMDVCNVKLSYVDPEEKDYIQIDINNLVLPFVFFFGCSLLAVTIQLVFMYQEKKGKPSVLGRRQSILAPGARPDTGIETPVEEEKQEDRQGEGTESWMDSSSTALDRSTWMDSSSTALDRSTDWL